MRKAAILMQKEMIGANGRVRKQEWVRKFDTRENSVIYWENNYLKLGFSEGEKLRNEAKPDWPNLKIEPLQGRVYFFFVTIAHPQTSTPSFQCFSFSSKPNITAFREMLFCLCWCMQVLKTQGHKLAF